MSFKKWFTGCPLMEDTYVKAAWNASAKEAEKEITELKNKCFMLEKGKYGVDYYACKIGVLKINDSQQKVSIKELAEAFDEVCLDIRNHAPNYVHPLELKTSKYLKG